MVGLVLSLFCWCFLVCSLFSELLSVSFKFYQSTGEIVHVLLGYLVYSPLICFVEYLNACLLLFDSFCCGFLSCSLFSEVLSRSYQTPGEIVHVLQGYLVYLPFL